MADKTNPNERLAHARVLAGYETATSAAEAMGVGVGTYVHHENGTRGFERVADRYAKFFRVSIEWLLTGRGEPKSKSLDVRAASLSHSSQELLRSFLDYLEYRDRQRSR